MLSAGPCLPGRGLFPVLQPLLELLGQSRGPGVAMVLLPCTRSHVMHWQTECGSYFLQMSPPPCSPLHTTSPADSWGAFLAGGLVSAKFVFTKPFDDARFKNWLRGMLAKEQRLKIRGMQEHKGGAVGAMHASLLETPRPPYNIQNTFKGIKLAGLGPTFHGVCLSLECDVLATHH